MSIKNTREDWNRLSEEEKWEVVAKLCRWDTLRWERELGDDGLEHKVLRGVTKGNRVVRNVPHYLTDLNAIIQAVDEEEEQHNESWAANYTYRLLEVAGGYTGENEFDWDDVHWAAQATAMQRAEAFYMTMLQYTV